MDKVIRLILFVVTFAILTFSLTISSCVMVGDFIGDAFTKLSVGKSKTL